jgi:tetratricopeptide (TPR) repeat protein
VPGRTDEGAAGGQDRDLGALLRDWRRAAGLTQEELADRSGLSIRAISDLERGRSTRPYRRSLALIADALGLTAAARQELSGAAIGHPARHPPPAAPAGPDTGAAVGPQLVVVPRQLPGALRHFARLPLAVSLAVARAAARPSFRLSALVDELHDAGGRLDALDSADAATSIRAVFSWSYQNLSEPTARLFRLLSEHPGPDFTVAAAASLAGVPPSQARTALRELAGSHLLSEPAPGRYAWHDLLRAFAGEQARGRDGDGARRAARQRLLDHYLHTCHPIAQLLDPTRDPIPLPAPPAGVRAEQAGTYQQAWAWLEAEYQVLLAVIDLAAASQTSRHAWQLPWAIETFFFRRGHWHDFLAVQRAAVAAALRLADVPGQAHAYHGLGRACTMTGAHTEATEHLSQALRLYQELGTLTGEARCEIDVALAVARQGSYRAGLGHAQRAGRLYRAAGHLAGQAGALNNTGWYQIQLGEYELARGNCQQALTMFRQAGSQYGVAHTLDSLGYACFKLGDYGSAVSCFEQALSTFSETGDHLNRVDTLAHLVETYLAAGNQRAADETRQRALAILDDLHHADAAVLRAKL